MHGINPWILVWVYSRFEALISSFQSCISASVVFSYELSICVRLFTNRGGQFPLITGNDSHGYTGPVAGLGSGGGGSFGGGSFGSSSNGRQHVRGCSSG